MAEEKVQLPTKDELAQLSREACIAYAARCALRVLPLTAQAAVDAVWGKDSAVRLESIARAVQASIASCSSRVLEMHAAYAAAHAKSAYVSAYAASYAAACAAYAASKSASVAFDGTYGDGAAAVAYTAYAADAAAYAARADYSWLIGNTSSPTGLFEQDLWPQGEEPDDWRQTYQSWQNVMEANGLSDLAKQVDAWMRGDFDPDAIARDVEAWAERTPAPSVKRMACGTSAEGDQPATQDTLGRDKYAAVLADFIANRNTTPPLAISIEGAWGSGKTTFIHLLKNALNGRAGKRGAVERVFFCQFNPWRYQDHEALWAAFALQFLDQLRKGQSSCWARYWRQLKYELSIVDRAGVTRNGLRVLASGATLLLVLLLLQSFVLVDYSWQKIGPLWGIGLPVGAAALFGAGKALWNVWKEVGGWLTWRVKAQLNKPDYTSRIGFLDQFHKDFDRVVKAYVGENERVVAFIDDLDRCDVPVAAELMRGINLMLNESDRVVFILGLDRAKVAAGLAVKHQDLLPYLYAQQLAGAKEGEVEQQLRLYGLEYGHEFIEKFIQLSFRLPAPSGSEIDGFLRAKLKVEPSQPEGAKRDSSVPPQGKSESEQAPVPPPSATTSAPSGPTSPPVAGTTAESGAATPVTEKPFVLDESQMLPALKHAARVFEGNPRRINQLINLVRLQLRLSDRLGYDLSAGQIAKWTAISLRWPRFVLELAALPHGERRAFLEELGSNYKSPASACYKRWILEVSLLELFRDLGPGDVVPARSDDITATERGVFRSLELAPGEMDYDLRPQVLDWLLQLNLAIPIAETTAAAGAPETSSGARPA